MIALLYVLCYFVGAALTLRGLVLNFQDRIDRRRAKGKYTMSLMLEYGPHIVVGAMFWPFLILGWGTWKLLFPRGVKSKYAREREREAKLKAAERAAEKEAERLRKMEQEVLAFGTKVGYFGSKGAASDAQRLREDQVRIFGGESLRGPASQAMVELADEIVKNYQQGLRERKLK
jgi:hypothetical protein